MIFLTNTAHRITVGPLLGQSDAKTPQTALTVSELSVQMYRVTGATAVSRQQFAPTGGGISDNDMILVPGSTDGVYDLELTAEQLNWMGNGRINVLNTAAILVWFMDFQLVSLQYWNFMFGATPPEVALTTASREATADSLILRNQMGGSNNGRRFGESLLPLRNRNETVGQTQYVYYEDGVTVAWTATVATDSEAVPITGVNPVS
jgi:hypothetical protein